MNRSIVAMLLGTFVLRVSTAVTGGMLVFFLADLGFGSNDVALLHGGFYITELAGAIAFGILADIVGRKLVMILGPVFGGIAVFMTGFTTHLPVLFVTRLLEGSSTAASVPSTLGFIAVETSHDDRLRGRVVSWFELLSLAGMLAIGPALAGRLYDALGRGGFFVNVGFYAVAFLFYGYGVKESRRLRTDDAPGDRVPAEGAPAGGTPAASPAASPARNAARYVRILTNRRILLFAPTWLAINAILGLWVSQGPFLLAGGGMQDHSQWLLTLNLSNTDIGDWEARFAIFLGVGILFWGNLFGRIRRTTMLLWGTGAFAVAALAVFLINHTGGAPLALAICTPLLLAAIFVLSGATPAALGMLADVSEGFHEDRSAIMGFYSVFMGIGQVVGIAVAGPAATWRGIDGLVFATGGLLAVGLVALLNLRAREHEFGNRAGAGGGLGLSIGSMGTPAHAKEER